MIGGFAATKSLRGDEHDFLEGQSVMNPLDLGRIGDIFTSSDSKTVAESANNESATERYDEPLLVMQNDADGAQAGLDAVILSENTLTDGHDSDAVNVTKDSSVQDAAQAVLETADDADASDAASVDTQISAPATASTVGNISEQYITQSVEDDVQSVSFGNHETGNAQTEEASATSAHSVDSKAVSGLLSRLSVAEAADVTANPGVRLDKLQSLLGESQSMARQLYLTASADAGDHFWATLDQIRAVQSRILSSLGNASKKASVSSVAMWVDAPRNTNTSAAPAAPIFNGVDAGVASGNALSGGSLSTRRSFVG